MNKNLKSHAHLNCFKAYDIRGIVGEEITNDIVYRIARSVVQHLKVKKIIIGFDARETSLNFAKSAAEGACASGANVLDIGLAGTEEMYWAVSQFEAGAGIAVTASHNPIEYNGMKIVQTKSKPILPKDFNSIKRIAEKNIFFEPDKKGKVFKIKEEAREAYLKKILSFIDLQALKPLKIVLNLGNGAAGPTLIALEKSLKKRGVKVNLIKLLQEPDPTFPYGIPNPLLEENRKLTADAVKKEKADFGVAFDGDFDRCFFLIVRGLFCLGSMQSVCLLKFF